MLYHTALSPRPNGISASGERFIISVMEEAERPVGRADRPAEVIEINPEGLQRHTGTVQRATRWNTRCETLFK